MDFTIKNNKVEVIKNNKKYVVGISENTEKELVEKFIGSRTLKDKLALLAIILLPFLFIAFVIYPKIGAINSFILASLPIVIVSVLILLYNWYKKSIKNFIATIESDEEYILAKEVSKTKNLITEEQSKLSDLMNAKYSSKVLIGKEVKSFHQEELQQLEKTLRHLELRIKLRKVKIDFFQKYLKKVQLIQAINIAEDAILLDYQAVKEERNSAIINPDKIKEEILYLKPLSEKMSLCESEIVAHEIINELEGVSKRIN